MKNLKLGIRNIGETFLKWGLIIASVIGVYIVKDNLTVVAGAAVFIMVVTVVIYVWRRR